LKFIETFSPFIFEDKNKISTKQRLIVTASLKMNAVESEPAINQFLLAWGDTFFWVSHEWAIQDLPGKRSHKRFTFSWPSLDDTRRYLNLTQEQPERFFGLLVGDSSKEEICVAIFIYSLYLATWWHVVRQGLCLHCSAVSRNGQGFLFLGQSTAGKSTVARLSLELGHQVLGDDLNFVFPETEKHYLVAAGPSVQPLEGAYAPIHSPVCGVFNLVKDDCDSLKSLSQKETAQALWESFRQAPTTAKLPPRLMGYAFETCCAMARTIPGYELHFRKSPDFWKLIDEQFPG